jgi:hypothetical protein
MDTYNISKFSLYSVEEQKLILQNEYEILRNPQKPLNVDALRLHLEQGGNLLLIKDGETFFETILKKLEQSSRSQQKNGQPQASSILRTMYYADEVHTMASYIANDPDFFKAFIFQPKNEIFNKQLIVVMSEVLRCKPTYDTSTGDLNNYFHWVMLTNRGATDEENPIYSYVFQNSLRFIPSIISQRLMAQKNLVKLNPTEYLFSVFTEEDNLLPELSRLEQHIEKYLDAVTLLAPFVDVDSLKTTLFDYYGTFTRRHKTSKYFAILETKLRKAFTLVGNRILTKNKELIFKGTGYFKFLGGSSVGPLKLINTFVGTNNGELFLKDPSALRHLLHLD